MKPLTVDNVNREHLALHTVEMELELPGECEQLLMWSEEVQKYSEIEHTSRKIHA